MTVPKNTDDKRITPGFLEQMGKGRPKGVLNKSTRLAKDAIASAAEELGGVERLVEWCKEDPKNEGVFWGSIYPRLLPLQVTGEDGGPVQAAVSITFRNATNPDRV